MSATTIDQRVIVIGAGPVGLFLALRLAQFGIKVDLIERDKEINELPRAAGYYASASMALKDAGLLHQMAEEGYLGTGLAWVKPPVPDGAGGTNPGDIISYIPFSQGSKEHPEKGMLILPQSRFSKVILKQVQENSLIDVYFGAELIDIKDDGDRVVATGKFTDTGEEKQFTGSFLVGADGGKSTTRKLLGIDLPGHTWPERLIAADVRRVNEIVPKYGVQFVVQQTFSTAIVPLTEPLEGKESLWRYAICTDAADTRSDEDVLSDDNLQSIFEKIMPGPAPLSYKVERRAIYRTHQRLATTMKRGRCTLAGDAAHLNNPYGAMGLTTGLLDADALAVALKMIIKEGYPLSLLDLYSDDRRKVFQFFVDPTTTQNKIRMACDPEKAGDEDWLLRQMKAPNPALIGQYILPFVTTWRTDIAKLAASQGIVSQAN